MSELFCFHAVLSGIYFLCTDGVEKSLKTRSGMKVFGWRMPAIWYNAVLVRRVLIKLAFRIRLNLDWEFYGETAMSEVN